MNESSALNHINFHQTSKLTLGIHLTYLFFCANQKISTYVLLEHTFFQTRCQTKPTVLKQ